MVDLNIYNQIELESEVMSASRHRLVQLLLNKCLQQINLAKDHMSAKEVSGKNHCISRANEIVGYLRTTLNFEHEEARKLSELLDSLYARVEKNFFFATLENDEKYLNQAYVIMKSVKDGWDGISAK